jgi:carbamoyltransferase
MENLQVGATVGVSFSHNSAVALAIDGRLGFALQEERPTGIKNATTFPRLAYARMLSSCLDGDPGRIDLVVFPTAEMQEFHFFVDSGQFPDGRYFPAYADRVKPEVPEWFRARDQEAIDEWIRSDRQRIAELNGDEALANRAFDYYETHLGVDRQRFQFVRHHAAHAYAACLGLGETEQPWLVFTVDASGDSESSTVSLFHGNRLELLSSNDRYPSLGRLYREVTAFLGMKPDEHESKVMGLAAYARPDHCGRVAGKFREILWLDESGRFQCAFPMHFARYFLLESCVYERFDAVAGAVQTVLEELIIEWMRYWIQRTGCRNVAVGGGVFANVKLNQRLAACNAVEQLHIVPSPGDESLVFGACYYGSTLLERGPRVGPLDGLDLGPAATPAELDAAVAELDPRSYEVRWVDDIEDHLAALLASGELVGRFAGRPEWGSRALGHRSILADPRERSNVENLNRLVKARDFWMPFAPSILDEDWSEYVVDEPAVDGSYMLVSFDATERGRRELPAALHHGDHTLRPQRVYERRDPAYHRLIRLYKERTGVGAVLNTSLNLHGDPMAMSPSAAVRVLAASGLRLLALGDRLITKRP